VTTITVWMIVVMATSGHRVEVAPQYDTQAECLTAARAIQLAHPGSSATCGPREIAVTEQRARQLAAEEWSRERPAEREMPRR
jgi:hypothetical protein